MQRIRPCLWFDSQAEEAANSYVSVFQEAGMGGKVSNVARYSKEAAQRSGRPEGSVMTVDFELDGQRFMGLNGGPLFKFTPAISMMVNCDTQKEIDLLWERLSQGGQEVQCGWLTDRFGMSWQIVPAKFSEWMKDPERANRVMAKLLTMRKLDIATLEKA